MSHLPNMENQHPNDINVHLDAEYTSPEQLLATLEPSLGFPNSTDTFAASSFCGAGNGTGVNDWNYGMEGLLDPLRRPDTSQMPADVLAFLVNSGQYSELLNPSNPALFGSNLSEPRIGNVQGRQQQNNYAPQLGTNWTPSNISNPNQHPNYTSQSQSMLSGASTGAPAGLTQFSNTRTPPQNRLQSRLSPLAPEFIPRQQHEEESMRILTMAIAELNHSSNYQPQSTAGIPQQFAQQQYRYPTPAAQTFTPRGPVMRQQRHFSPRSQTGSSQPQRHHRQQFKPQQTAQDNAYDYESNADRVLTFVVDTITYLTHDPANFNSSMKKVLRVLSESLTDSDTLEIMVTLIIEQSITMRNFFSTGARMCQWLGENKIKAGSVTAQNCVIKQVQEAFKSALDKMPAAFEDLRERHIGLLMFLGELFVRFKVDGKIFFGFGVAIAEIIPKFLEFNPGETPKLENVRVVLNVLKLTGWELEQNSNPLLKTEVDKMFAFLSEILTGTDLPPNTRALIDKIFELRKINWGRADSEPTPPSTEAANSESEPSSCVYGGKEHEAIYEEPSSEDEEEDVYLDEEAEKCFEQFLSENKSQG